MPKDGWDTISLGQLTGVFDARSRPADLAPGAFRWKQNFAISDTGKLSRCVGFRKLFSGPESPSISWTLDGQPLAITGTMSQLTIGEAGEWRIKDGKVQGFNPDTGLWHTFRLTGTPPQPDIDLDGEA